MRLTLFALILALMPSYAQAEESTTRWESDLLDQASQCAEFKPGTRQMLVKMLRQEEEHNLPNHVRGITVAIACLEAKYNPKAEGDHRFSKDKKTPMAVGLYQMWPWWKHNLNVKRNDPTKATEAWLKFVTAQADKCVKRCKPKTDKQKWAAAIAYSMKGPGKRCKQVTTHLLQLRKWQEEIGLPPLAVTQK